MKKEVLVLIIFVSLVSFVNAQLADSAWPTFHGNLQRTGLSPYDTSHVDGTIKWFYEVGKSVQSSPAIGGDGTIYVGADDGYVYSFTPEGEIKWKTKIGTPLYKEFGGQVSYESILASPAIAKDGTIYISSRDQYLFALNEEGDIKWKFPLNFTFDHWGSPAIGNDGTIYITSSPPKGGLYAINPDGTEKWHYETSEKMFNSPAIGHDGLIYVAFLVGFNTTKLLAFNSDGDLNWDLTLPYDVESTPSIADDGTIYLGSFTRGTSNGAGIIAVKEKKVIWYFEVEGSTEVMSTPAIDKDGTIYFGVDDSNNFYAINSNGTKKWQFPSPGVIDASASIGADGTIYVGISNVKEGEPSFIALNSDGTEKWKRFNRANSIVSTAAIGRDGTVYVGSHEGKLYAFGGSGEGTEEAIPDEEIVQNTTEEWEVEYVPQENKEYVHQIEASSDDPEECVVEGNFIGEEECRSIMDSKYGKQGFFSRLYDWFKNLFR